MKKQLTITTAMAAALLALPGCSSRDEWNEDIYAERDTQVCVDQQGERVDDDLCTSGAQSSYGSSGGYHGGGGSNAFLWYYLGRQSAVPYYGESVRDPRFASGSYVPMAGAVYDRAPVASRMTRSQAVSRGGLGSSSRRFGGGWS